jgi:hypothetical protein
MCVDHVIVMAEVDDEELESLREIYAPSGIIELPNTASDQVLDNVFIGERSIVLNKDSLKKLGITHVVNCAHGTTRYHVNSGTQFYGDDFVYYGIEANDEIEFDLTPHFRPTAEFIKDALKGGGKVMVNCVEGVSRSATIVIAYCMLERAMSLCDAMTAIRKGRNIAPNDGFLRQLTRLEKQLKTNS